MKKLYIIILALSIVHNAMSQFMDPNNPITDEAGTFTFGEPYDANTSYEYTASEFIKLVEGQGKSQGGFEYSPKGGNYFVAKNDPLMVIPPEDGDVNGGPPNNNDGGVVGEISSGFSVSSTGAAIYSVPIKVPPGTAGMTPEIALIYNSQAGKGYVGKNWTIAGLSSITRTARTFYYNGKPDALNFDNYADQLILDGKKLLNYNGTYYKTETDEFSEIQLHSSSNYFTIKTKSGLIKEYGKTVNSRQLLQGNTVPLAWHINKITDTKGNYIKYNYYTDQITGEAYIESIDYTGNNSISPWLIPYNKIVFNYESYQNFPTQFYTNHSTSQSGLHSTVTKRLVSISCEYNDTEIKKYSLTYDFLDQYEHDKVLVALKETGWNGTFLNKLVFDWVWSEEPLTGTAQAHISPPQTYSTGHHFAIGDFNGDGLTDYAKISNNGSDYQCDILFNNNSPNPSWLSFQGDQENDIIHFSEAFRSMQVGDYDGNGLSDVLIQYYKGQDPYSPYDYKISFMLILTNKNSNGTIGYTINNSPNMP